jgi:hypothetical protein
MNDIGAGCDGIGPRIHGFVLDNFTLRIDLDFLSAFRSLHFLVDLPDYEEPEPGGGPKY